MLTPDFLGRRVRSEPKLNQSVEHQTLRDAPESKRHDRAERKGHILIQKHDNERHSYGGKVEKSPQARRREIHKNLQGQSQPSILATRQHLEMVKELQNVSEKLALCYEQLKSDYMREMARDVDLNAADSANVLALKDLFQQLMNEMVHLKGILSRYNIINGGEIDSFEKPANNQVSETTGPNDLVYLKGPITEDSIITILQARFHANCYYTKVGPVHVIINPFSSLESKYDANPSHVRSIVTPALEKLFQTQTPQMLILSGETGSGKSRTAQMLIKELMHLSCGTSQTNLVKHLNAAVTALNSLGNARTMNNQESSKLAFLYEFYFNNQVIHKTKIKCIPLIMSRVVQPRKDESNFRIFYQLFAGLNPQERAKLQLHTHSADELRYLYNYPSNNECEIELLRKEFQSWKAALQFLGIPFTDVTKVLAAILLLGNVQFTEKSPRVLEVVGGVFELKAVSILLGLPYTSLFCGLTKKVKVTKSDATIQSCSATQANYNRDALAKSLYLRMLSAIVRRSNCSRKSAVSMEHNSSNNRDASESVPSPNVGDQVLGIADLFGFDKTICNRMEQMCANLCSETIQHFYTTHVFKSAEEYCREEGIQNEVDVIYHENSQCIELLTCLETGILTYLDSETLGNGSTKDLVEKLREKHADDKKFFTTNCKWNEFGIAHHTEKVIYDADALLRGNDDSIADDIIQMFSPEQCSFGFAVHLFASDFNLLPQKDDFDTRGIVDSFDSSISSSAQTFSQKYQDGLDELLKTLINSDPWFILCLKSNSNGVPNQFGRETVCRQIKSLQVIETVHLFRSGYTHRMRLIPFAQRYFVHDDQLSQTDALEIAQSYQKLLSESRKENPHKILYIGRKHVFLSEILWQELEKRRLKRHAENLRSSTGDVSSIPTDRNRKDISPATRDERAEPSQSRAEIGVSIPPAIPKRRGYTVIDNKKIAFPQVRVMTDDYRDGTNGQDVVFTSGENVKVIGASPKAGYLAVESRHKTGWVPSTFTRLMTDDVM